MAVPSVRRLPRTEAGRLSGVNVDSKRSIYRNPWDLSFLGFIYRP